VIATLWRRGAAVPLGLAAVGALVVSLGSTATAAPAPTPAQVQAELNQLTSKAQVLGQQYDQAVQQLNAANAQLTAINSEVSRYKARDKSERAKVAQIATLAYENGSITSPQVLLTAGDPQKILDGTSMLQELSATDANELTTYASTVKQLNAAQQAAKRVAAGKTALKNQAAAKKAANQKLIDQQNALLAQLSPAQQTGVGNGGLGGGSVTVDPAPAPNAQAQAVVNFAVQAVKDGCPYVFGGTGPCADGYDCSGLTQAAWASAGVSIPRTSEDQAALPAVPEADMEPGDIMEFDGDGHVGIFIGNNTLIDAPHTGLDVEEVSFTGWYADNFDGAVRP
jgi:cell wall-associated NlpC family hydrolase